MKILKTKNLPKAKTEQLGLLQPMLMKKWRQAAQPNNSRFLNFEQSSSVKDSKAKLIATNSPQVELWERQFHPTFYDNHALH